MKVCSKDKSQKEDIRELFILHGIKQDIKQASKQSSDYEITADIVVNHTKKKFDRGNNVSEAL